jgi:hypothetical protein
MLLIHKIVVFTLLKFSSSHKVSSWITDNWSYPGICILLNSYVGCTTRPWCHKTFCMRLKFMVRQCWVLCSGFQKQHG